MELLMFCNEHLDLCAPFHTPLVVLPDKELQGGVQIVTFVTLGMGAGTLVNKIRLQLPELLEHGFT